MDIAFLEGLIPFRSTTCVCSRHKLCFACLWLCRRYAERSEPDSELCWYKNKLLTSQLLQALFFSYLWCDFLARSCPFV